MSERTKGAANTGKPSRRRVVTCTLLLLKGLVVLLVCYFMVVLNPAPIAGQQIAPPAGARPVFASLSLDDPLVALPPQAKWVRVTPASGEMKELISRNLVQNANSLYVSVWSNRAGRAVTNTIKWSTPPEEITEDALFDLTLHATQDPDAPPLTACWNSYDERERTYNPLSNLSGVSTLNPPGFVTIKYKFHYMGKGYENAYLELKDTCGSDAPANLFKIRWDYKRVAPPEATKTKPDRDPSSISRVVSVTGDVRLLDEAGTVRAPAVGEDIYNVNEAEQLQTGADGIIVLKLWPNDYLITVTESTQINMKNIATYSGRAEIDVLIKRGKVIIKAPSKSTPAPYRPDNASRTLSVKTPTAHVRSKKTIYAVSYDEKTGGTAVGVEEGEVEVTPAKASLKPFTLAAGKQVMVTREQVGSISSFSGNDLGNGDGTSTFLKVVYWVLGIIAALYIIGRLTGNAPAKKKVAG